jgi:hypothetical protein
MDLRPHGYAASRPGDRTGYAPYSRIALHGEIAPKTLFSPSSQIATILLAEMRNLRIN